MSDPSRQALTYAELDYDFCSWVYGTGSPDDGLEHRYEFEGTLSDSIGSADGTADVGGGSLSYDSSSGVKFGSQRVQLEGSPIGQDSAYIDLPVGLSGYNLNFGFLFYIGDIPLSDFRIKLGSILLEFFPPLIEATIGGERYSSTGDILTGAIYVNCTDGIFHLGTSGDVELNIPRIAAESLVDPGHGDSFRFLADDSNVFYLDEFRFYNRPIGQNELDSLNDIVNGPSMPNGCQAVLGTDGEAKCFNTRATCQDPANYNPATKVLRFVKPAGFEPKSIDAIPSINRVDTAPARIRPGEDLGERASVSVEFADHPYHDRTVDKYAAERVSGAAQADGVGYDPEDQGTYWGKWRARNPFFQHHGLRIIQGTADQSLFEMETRHYVMESIDGPAAEGLFTITAKDALKLADDDRAQAPRASEGTLAADLSDSATSATLSPSGIGSEYPGSGIVTIGNEVMSFTRSGDTLTLTRGQYGTAAASHSEGDTVQLAIEYDGVAPSVILEDLLTNYAGVPSTFIPSDSWGNEDSEYINRLFATLIVEPTGVRELIAQLSEQVGFTLWWDEIAQLIRFRAIRQPDQPPIVLSDDSDFLAGSINVKEQQKKRISQVWVYFGVVDPTEDLEEARNYLGVYVGVVPNSQYQKPKIKKIYARWIDRFNRPAAEDLAARIISRYQNPPRKFTFSMPWKHQGVSLGNVYDARTRIMQTPDGQPDDRRIIVLSYERGSEKINVESEEFLYVPNPEDDVHRVPVGQDTLQMSGGSPFNLREAFDNIYTGVDGSDTVELIIADSAVLGSNSTGDPACTIGDWPSGTTVRVIVNGRIQGAAGSGGRAGDSNNFNGQDGQDGGIAILTDRDIEIDNQGGIWGGAGGAGGGGVAISSTDSVSHGGGGGGSGAGYSTAAGGAGGSASVDGEDGADGTRTAGGDGGTGAKGIGVQSGVDGGDGGDGGDPGQDGEDGNGGSGGQFNGSGGSGGNAGAAIDGASHVTFTTQGDIRGAQTN